MIKFCVLSSGSDGNCYYIASANTGILVDAGISCTKIRKSLEHLGETIDSLSAVFLTHEHSDHTSGLRVLLKKYPMNLYLTDGTYAGIRGAEELNTVRPVKCIRAGDVVQHGDLTVYSYPVSHDAVEPVCYKIVSAEGDCVGIITDLGWADPEVIRAFRDCDLLLLESNHDTELLKIGPYPSFLKQRILSENGHLSNDSAGIIARNILSEGRLKYLILGHLSETNNHPDLAFATVSRSVREFGYCDGIDYELEVSIRNRVGKMYVIKKMLAAFLFVFAFLISQAGGVSYAEELLLREQVTHDLPVLNVVEVHGGRTTMFISRKLTYGTLEDYSAPFEAGGLSRLTTSLALLELLHRRNIPRDASIAEYLPAELHSEQYSERFQGITFQHLFLHTSGILDSRFSVLSTAPYSESVRTRAIRYLQTAERRFEAGMYSLRSTADFALMTVLIEQLSGEDFSSYMGKFFAEKGMKDSYIRSVLPDEDGSAEAALSASSAHSVQNSHSSESRHSLRSPRTSSAPHSLMPRFYISAGILTQAESYYAKIPAADNFVTTLEDLEKLLHYLTSDRVPAEFDLFTELFANIPEDSSRSTVFDSSNYGGTSVFLLDSALPGGINRILFVPRRRLAFFIAYNTETPLAREEITRTLLERYGIQGKMTADHSAKNEPNGSASTGIDPGRSANLNHLAGHYSPVNLSGSTVEKFVGFSCQLKFSAFDDGIFIGDDFFRPLSPVLFFSDVSQKYARLVTDDDGRLLYLILDNELYRKAFSSNVQILLIGLLAASSFLLLVLIFVKWRDLIAGRVDDRPRVWLLFVQLILLAHIITLAFAVRETEHWRIAYGGGWSLLLLKYFAPANLVALSLAFFSLLYTRKDYKWNGIIRVLMISEVPLIVFYISWLLYYRFVF